MKPLTTDINLDEETRAVVDFVAKTWEPIDNLEEIVLQIRVSAQHAARGWIDAYDLGFKAGDLQSARATMLEALPQYAETKTTVSTYDAVCHFLAQVSLKGHLLNQAGLAIDGTWDYGRRTSALSLKISNQFPGFRASRPLGWTALAAGYEDFDGQETFDSRAAKADFAGSRVESAVSGDLCYRLALPYVMYDEVSHGRKAATTLVSSVYSHFLGIQQFLNAQSAMSALSAYVEAQPQGLVFACLGEPQNPHLLVLKLTVRPAPSESDWLKAVEGVRLYDLLSPDEKKRQADDNRESFDALMQKLPTCAEIERANRVEMQIYATAKMVFSQ